MIAILMLAFFGSRSDADAAVADRAACRTLAANRPAVALRRCWWWQSSGQQC